MAVNYASKFIYSPNSIMVHHNQDGSHEHTEREPYSPPTDPPMSGFMFVNYILLGCLMALLVLVWVAL